MFLNKDKQIEVEHKAKKTADWQLNSLGHQILNKRAMLYDRNLSSKLAKKYIYSDQSLQANEQTASQIIEKFVLKNVNFEMFPDQVALAEFKNQLNQILVKFISLHRTCPYRVFLHCYCKNQKAKEMLNKKVSEHLSKLIFPFLY